MNKHVKNTKKNNRQKISLEQNEHDIWGFLYRELAKLQVLCRVYKELVVKVESKNGRYNAAFQLFLDSFTSYIHMTIYKFFDKRGDSWSLVDYEKLDQLKVAQIKGTAQEFIEARKKRYAHWDKKHYHVGNFNFLTENGVNQIEDIIKRIESLLVEINKNYKYDEGYVLDWIGAENSVSNMISDLMAYDHMKEWKNKFME